MVEIDESAKKILENRIDVFSALFSQAGQDMHKEVVPTIGSKEYQNGVGIIDHLIGIQIEENSLESDITTIMSTKTGDQLLKWSYAVRRTWWYKLFSRFDPSKGR